MEWIWDVAILVGIGITFMFQRRQMSTLKDEIASQKRIIDGVKTYVDMYDPQKIKEHIKLAEERAKLLTRKDYEDRITKSDEHYKEWRAALDALFMSVMFLPSSDKNVVFSQIADGITKDELRAYLSFTGDADAFR